MKTLKSVLTRLDFCSFEVELRMGVEQTLSYYFHKADGYGTRNISEAHDIWFQFEEDDFSLKLDTEVTVSDNTIFYPQNGKMLKIKVLGYLELCK